MYAVREGTELCKYLQTRLAKEQFSAIYLKKLFDSRLTTLLCLRTRMAEPNGTCLVKPYNAITTGSYPTIVDEAGEAEARRAAYIPPCPEAPGPLAPCP